ncbi:sensor histidine kinase [Umezawaea sp.]|uniref:sensor histidine kinase n=1 Tax=Umezawaea sp. TaxID=1955258 RepID=UPI002ED68377
MDSTREGPGLGWWRTRRGAAFDIALALVVTAVPVLAWLLAAWTAPFLPTIAATGQPAATPQVVSVAGLFSHLAGSAFTLALVARRRFPAAVLSVIIVAEAFGHATLLGLTIALYTLAASGTSRVVLAGGGLLAAVAGLKPWAWTDVPGTAALYLVLGFSGVVVLVAVVLPIVLGLYVNARRGLLASLRERAQRLERERLLLARQVRTEERTRIAREMHDVVAHRVSLMVVHAGALEMKPGREPVAVAEAATRIADIGRQALGELRQAVGVLKVDDVEDSAPLAPQPTLDDLAELVEQSRSAGVPVDYRVEGRRRLANVAERTAYRIVQEGLTNVHKHAFGARTEISLRFLPDRLEVSVRNDAPRRSTGIDLPSGGHGLAGLKERLTLVGGEFESGPSDSGGFRIAARIPIAVPAG